MAENSHQKQTIFKCSLLGIDTNNQNVNEDLSEMLSDFQYTVLDIDGDTSLKYNIEFILTDDNFFSQIRDVYKTFHLKEKDPGRKLLPSFPKLMLQWGYQTGKTQKLSKIHIAQLSDISYKFKNNREKIVQIQAVDLRTFASQYMSDNEQHVPIFDKIGLTFPGSFDSMRNRQAKSRILLDRLATKGIPILYKVEGNERSLLRWSDVILRLGQSMTELITDTAPLMPDLDDDRLREINNLYSEAYDSYILAYLKGRGFDVESERHFIGLETGDVYMERIFAMTAAATKDFFKMYFNVDVELDSKASRYKSKYYYNSTWSKESLGTFGTLPLGSNQLTRFQAEEIYALNPVSELPEERNLKVDFHAGASSVFDLVQVKNPIPRHGTGGTIYRSGGVDQNNAMVALNALFLRIITSKYSISNVIPLDFTTFQDLENLSSLNWTQIMQELFAGISLEEYNKVFPQFYSDALDFTRMGRVRLRNGRLYIPPSVMKLSSNATINRKLPEPAYGKLLDNFIPFVRRFEFRFPDSPIFFNNVNLIEGYEGKRFDIVIPSNEDLLPLYPTGPFKTNMVTFKMPVNFNFFTDIFSYPNSILTDKFSTYGDLENLPPEQRPALNNIIARVNAIDKTEHLAAKKLPSKSMESQRLESVKLGSDVTPKIFSKLSTEERLEIRYANMKCKFVVPQGVNFYKSLQGVVKKHNEVFIDPAYHINFRVYNTRSTPNTYRFISPSGTDTSNYEDFIQTLAKSKLPPLAHIIEFSLGTSNDSNHVLPIVESFKLHKDTTLHNIKNTKDNKHPASNDAEYNLDNSHKPIVFQYGSQGISDIDDIVSFFEFNGDLRMLANTGGSVKLIDDLATLSAELNTDNLSNEFVNLLNQIVNAKDDNGNNPVRQYLIEVNAGGQISVDDATQTVNEMFETLERLIEALDPKNKKEPVEVNDNFFESIQNVESTLMAAEPPSPKDREVFNSRDISSNDITKMLKILSFIANRQIFNTLFSMETKYEDAIQRLKPYELKEKGFWKSAFSFEQFEPAPEDAKPSFISSPSVTTFKLRQNNPFNNKNNTGQVLNMVGAEYFKNANTPWEVKVKTLGIPELDGVEEIFEKRVVNLQIKDLSREYRNRTSAPHFLEGGYRILGIKHNLNTKGYTSEFTLLKQIES